MTFTAKKVRLYYNQGLSTSDKQWSIDQGEGEVEILARVVRVEGCVGKTQTAENKSVTAWLEFQDVVVECTSYWVVIRPQ